MKTPPVFRVDEAMTINTSNRQFHTTGGILLFFIVLFCVHAVYFTRTLRQELETTEQSSNDKLQQQIKELGRLHSKVTKVKRLHDDERYVHSSIHNMLFEYGKKL